MTKSKIDPMIILVIILIALIGLYMFASCSMKCSAKDGYRYTGGGYSDACEYSNACRWDNARTATMSDGTAGVCTAHGKLCPSFSKDHVRSKEWGYSPSMREGKGYRIGWPNYYGYPRNNPVRTQNMANFYGNPRI